MTYRSQRSKRNRRIALPATKWFGALTGIAGAILIAANIGQVGTGFILFALSSVAWIIAAIQHRDPSLLTMQAVFLVVNLIGIWRWL